MPDEQVYCMTLKGSNVRKRLRVFSILMILIGLFTLGYPSTTLPGIQIVAMVNFVGGLLGLARSFNAFRDTRLVGWVISFGILSRASVVLFAVVWGDITWAQAVSGALIWLCLWFSFQNNWRSMIAPYYQENNLKLDLKNLEEYFIQQSESVHEEDLTDQQ